MSKTEKLLAALTADPTPKSFRWADLTTLLGQLGFDKLSGRGARYKFVHRETRRMINLHRPHGSRPMRACQVRDVISALEELGIVL